jgi:hypothetical protein
MKSNSSNERSKIHVNWFNFSRKNSPEEELNLNNKGSNDFQKAYKKVFGYKKEKYSGSELHKNFLEDETEMATKVCHTDRRHDNLSNFSENFIQEKNEINFKQANSKKYYYLDFKNVDRILNGKDNYEQKNIKLAKFLIEINNMTKTASHEESKTLIQIQAKVLESMISLTKLQSSG